MFRVFLLCNLCFGLLFSGATRFPSGLAQTPLALRFVADSADKRKITVEVTGLTRAQLQRLKVQPPNWSTLLAVYAGTANETLNAGVPPMAGTYRVQADRLRFEPQFPLEPGVAYRAVFHPEALPGGRAKTVKPLFASFQLPPRVVARTTAVTNIYPSAAVVPENLLKFYLHFSGPMSRGQSYEHIKLRELGSGQAIELPFLEIAEELWDPTLTRLTLLIDPGRIKRGVTPLEEVGPALETGKRYRLEISAEWQDGQGNPLKEDFSKTFQVGPADRQPLDTAQWQMTVPPADSHEAVILRFPEPVDHALATRVINITNAAGEILGGTITLLDAERRWQFDPDHVWRRGQYNIVIQTTLEDLAGNNIGKPFEVDLFDNVQRQLTSATIKLPFQIN